MKSPFIDPFHFLTLILYCGKSFNLFTRTYGTCNCICRQLFSTHNIPWKEVLQSILSDCWSEDRVGIMVMLCLFSGFFHWFPSIAFLCVLSQGYPLLYSASVVSQLATVTQLWLPRFNHFRILCTIVAEHRQVNPNTSNLIQVQNTKAVRQSNILYSYSQWILLLVNTLNP